MSVLAGSLEAVDRSPQCGRLQHFGEAIGHGGLAGVIGPVDAHKYPLLQQGELSDGSAELDQKTHVYVGRPGCGTDTTVRPSMPSKSAGLHVWTARPFDIEVAAIIAS